MHADDVGEMSPKIKSVEYLAVGAGTVFDPPTNDLIYILYMQNVFLCVSGGGSFKEIELSRLR
jgi:hypothetical protein